MRTPHRPHANRPASEDARLDVAVEEDVVVGGRGERERTRACDGTVHDQGLVRRKRPRLLVGEDDRRQVGAIVVTVLREARDAIRAERERPAGERRLVDDVRADHAAPGGAVGNRERGRDGAVEHDHVVRTRRHAAVPRRAVRKVGHAGLVQVGDGRSLRRRQHACRQDPGNNHPHLHGTILLYENRQTHFIIILPSFVNYKFHVNTYSMCHCAFPLAGRRSSKVYCFPLGGYSMENLES